MYAPERLEDEREWLIRYAVRLRNISREDAEDAVQVCLIRCAGRTFLSREHFCNWARVVVTNAVRDSLRQVGSQQRRLCLASAHGCLPSCETATEQQVLARMEREHVLARIECLLPQVTPPEWMECIQAMIMEGEGATSVAARYGARRVTMAARKRRVLKRLAERLRAEGDWEG